MLHFRFLFIFSFGCAWDWLAWTAHYRLGYFPLWETILAMTLISIVLIALAYAYIVWVLLGLENDPVRKLIRRRM